MTVDGESGELRARRLPGATREVVEFCAGLPGPARVAYEAGPTGFGLARALEAAGIECVVAAPGKIERPAQDRVKTDRRDAERLVRLLMIGGLHAVRVPSERGGGAARPGPRARGRARRSDARPPSAGQAAAAPRRALRRHRRRLDARATAPGWPTVDLGDRGAQVTLLDYLGAIDALRRPPRRARGARSPSSCPTRRGRETVARLRCLRGIDTLSAVGLCAEVGDFERFERAGAADELPRPGAVREQLRRARAARARSPRPARATPAGCWSRPPGTTAAARAAATTLARRQDGQPAHVLAISWQAQQRLHRTWRRLDGERGKRRTIVAVAVARELAGFCWAIASAD